MTARISLVRTKELNALRINMLRRHLALSVFAKALTKNIRNTEEFLCYGHPPTSHESTTAAGLTSVQTIREFTKTVHSRSRRWGVPNC